MHNATARGRPRRPQRGDVLEAEALVGYLVGARRRGTLTPYCDRLVVTTGFGEECFELVRLAEGVRWRRTR